MRRCPCPTRALVALALVLTVMPATRASQSAAGNTSRVDVCGLVPKAEVKRLVPWQNMFDNMPLDDEPIGAAGSSCGFPSVHVQVMPFSQGFLDALRKTGPLEPVSGLGDLAFFRDNKGEYAEVYVRVGARLLTVQADGEPTVAATKPRAIDLAKLYVAKLR